MKITFYGYNTLLIEAPNKKIVIDPGGGFYLFKGWLKSLVPQSEWADITHIFVTHGDPDHYWHVDRLAAKSGASIICNEAMVRAQNNCFWGQEKEGSPIRLGFDCALLRIQESIEL